MSNFKVCRLTVRSVEMDKIEMRRMSMERSAIDVDGAMYCGPWTIVIENMVHKCMVIAISMVVDGM